MTEQTAKNVEQALNKRFGEQFDISPDLAGLDVLGGIAARGSTRHFLSDEVDAGLIQTLAAVALSSPTKSDLQQRDIIVVRDQDLLAEIKTLMIDQTWIKDIPVLLVFCGNNRRQRQIHRWRGHDFVNDHLDAFFNAAVDAGIALSTFVTAAEAIGLGCCPISAIRNHADKASDLLQLPEHVFPVAGLGLGWPKFPTPRISMRLPTAATVHIDHFDETGVGEAIDTYDHRRAAEQPYAKERMTDRYPALGDNYTWSEDKTRQYSAPERAEFGTFVRAHGFNLD